MPPIRNSESEIPSDLPPANLGSNGISPEGDLDSSIELKQIRTFQGDVAGALTDQRESLVSIQRSEQAKRIETEPQEESHVFKTLLLTLGTVVLLGIGSGGAWYAYTQYKTRSALPETIIAPNRFISYNSLEEFDSSKLKRLDLISIFGSEIHSNIIGEGEVKHIQFLDSKNPIQYTSTEKFFKILESQAPGKLIRALDPSFMVGSLGRTVVSYPVATSTATSTQASTTPEVLEPISIPSQSVFILFKVSSFENAFAGMLEWEKTMFSDIGWMFTAGQAGEIQPAFTDKTIRNKDVRILQDSNNQTVLLYSFLNNKMIIITDSEETFRSISTRLESELLSR